MTIRELYQVAKERKLLDAPIRICDGMAVSFYPEKSCITPGRYELVLDISALPVVEYDELIERCRIDLHDDVEASK